MRISFIRVSVLSQKWLIQADAIAFRQFPANFYVLGPCVNPRGCLEERDDDDDEYTDYDLQLLLGFTISQDHSGYAV